MKKEYDAVIIGAGISGLGVGALLAKAGKKVIVLEKGKLIGGRAASFKYKDYILGIGTHAGFVGGCFDELIERAGKKPGAREVFLDRWIYDFESHECASAFSAVSGNNPEIIKLVEAFSRVKPEDLEKYDAVSGKEWLSGVITDPKVWNLISWIGTILTCVPRMENLAASSLIEGIRTLFRGPSAFMAAKGIGDFCHILAEAINDNGGELKTGIAVSKILLEGKRVCGVLAEEGEEPVTGALGETIKIEAPLVVAAFPIWNLFDLVEEKHFPPDFVRKANKQNRKTANTGLIAGMKEPLYQEKTFIIANLPRAKLLGIVIMASNVVPSVAPKGEHLLEFVGICEHELERDRERLYKTIQLMKEDLEEMYPGWEKKTLWVRPYFHWVDPARNPGREGRFRPGPKAPGIEGLYFTGDSVNSRVAPGMECAADSAMICAREILG